MIDAVREKLQDALKVLDNEIEIVHRGDSSEETPRMYILWIGTNESQQLLFEVHVVQEIGEPLGDLTLQVIDAFTDEGIVDVQFVLDHPMTLRYLEPPLDSDIPADYSIIRVASNQVLTL